MQRQPRAPLTLLLCIVAASCALGGCRTSKPAQKQTVMAWRPVASWSGHDSQQTDSFNMDTGQWRIKWETSDQPSAGPKKFQVIVHSTISGRFVSMAVDHPSAGSGVSYMAEDPRQFFLDVESSGLDWKVAVEEGSVVEQ